MTYKDPKTGRERNLGPDNVGGSVWPWIGGLVILVAIAYGGWYFYDHSQKTADLSNPSPAADNASGAAAPNSGPGVQGAPGSTNGPATKPEAASGASSGTSGTGNVEPGTQPSQDATGVKGAPDSTNGPSDKKPGDTGTSK